MLKKCSGFPDSWLGGVRASQETAKFSIFPLVRVWLWPKLDVPLPLLFRTLLPLYIHNYRNWALVVRLAQCVVSVFLCPVMSNFTTTGGEDMVWKTCESESKGRSRVVSQEKMYELILLSPCPCFVLWALLDSVSLTLIPADPVFPLALLFFWHVSKTFP